VKNLFLAALFLVSVALIAVAAGGVRYSQAPHSLPQTPFEFTVEKGSSLKTVSKKLAEAGLFSEPYGLWLLGRITDQATGIRAGTYRLEGPISPVDLLNKLNAGDVVKLSLTFVEGITFAEMRTLLESHPGLKITTKGLADAEVLKRLGAPEQKAEGLFFPDTFSFSQGTSDIDVLRMSYQMMKQKLDQAWAKRVPDLPYASPYEALVMASIIEKETGRADERALIASVFVNRLRKPMRLQTDPTVIYGMGARFDGNIRRRDLEKDTPYNTYTRDGLPPTPIALPGWGSLLAAVQPQTSDKLYFVATGNGDGSHYFSRSLEEHNRAVAKYQLGR